MRIVDVYNSLFQQYGELVFIPGTFGKRDMVMCFNPNHIEQIYRNEGKYPMRPGFPSLNFYRKTKGLIDFDGFQSLITGLIFSINLC